MQSLNNNENKILFVNFNQDYSCFCIGTEEGYMILNTEKYKRIFHRSNSKKFFNIKIYRNEWRNRQNRDVKKN